MSDKKKVKQGLEVYLESLKNEKPKLEEFIEKNKEISSEVLNYFFREVQNNVTKITIDNDKNILSVELLPVDKEKPCIELTPEEIYQMHQSHVKMVQWNKLNKNYGRNPIDGIVAKSKEIVIGMVTNLPTADAYTPDGAFFGKLFQTWKEIYNDATIDKFPNDVSYGIVFAVGKDVESDIEVGDTVQLRGALDRYFFAQGKIYHFINEYDISVIKKKINPFEDCISDQDE